MLPPRDNFVRKTLAVYWRVTIKYLSPLFLVVVFMYYMYDFLSKPSQYEAVVAGQVSCPCLWHFHSALPRHELANGSSIKQTLLLNHVDWKLAAKQQTANGYTEKYRSTSACHLF